MSHRRMCLLRVVVLAFAMKRLVFLAEKIGEILKIMQMRVLTTLNSLCISFISICFISLSLFFFVIFDSMRLIKC